MRAISLLTIWKLKNSLRTLLSDPRKLLPFLLVVGWIGLSLALSSLGMSSGSKGPKLGAVDPLLFDTGVFIAVIFMSMTVIDTGLGDGLIAFAPPDLDYLFPSPISRRVVLAYRLPALTFSSFFIGAFILFFVRMVSNMTGMGDAHPLGDSPPSWLGALGIFLCVGFHTNLAMYVAVKFQERRTFHRILVAVFIVAGLLLGVYTWQAGVPALEVFSGTPAIRTLFFVPRLATDCLTAPYHSHFNVSEAGWLLLAYLVSLIPMFATNANFYEQSIVSTDRVAGMRRAAKGGFAALQAARASNVKYKSTRDYTVKPFGQGAVALFWAHLCAAMKRPYVNFLSPVLGGILVGFLGGVGNRTVQGMGFGIVIGLSVYISFAFMGGAKTASEAAIRRRELIAPLPIPGWQVVLANLGVPFVSVKLFYVTAGFAYLALMGTMGGLVFVGLVFFGTLRLACRMLLQYIIVLGYPDAADKVQQFLAMGIYYVFSLPLFVGEAIVAIPGLLLQSLWVGLICLTVLQIPYFAGLLFLAGKISERAVATGEPVSLWGTLRRR